MTIAKQAVKKQSVSPATLNPRNGSIQLSHTTAKEVITDYKVHKSNLDAMFVEFLKSDSFEREEKDEAQATYQALKGILKEIKKAGKEVSHE